MNENKKEKPEGIRYSVPYLPLDNYIVDVSLTKILPSAIAKKYSVMPVDKIGNNLSVVMEDPFNEEAIDAIKKHTGCEVRRLLGKTEEIASAIERYYKADKPEIIDEEKPAEPPPKKLPPAKKETKASDINEDAASEKRQFFRFKCTIAISFPVGSSYEKSETVDISYNGVSFLSKTAMPGGSYLIIRLEPFKRAYDYPIILLVQVIRRTLIGPKLFCIGARILQTTRENIKKIVDYATSKGIPCVVPEDRIDRRKYERFKINIALWFPDRSNYAKSETIDISYAGLLFETDNVLKVGSYLPLQMELPKSVSDYPVALLVQVVRVVLVKNKIFYVGARIINVGEDQIEELIRYASRAGNIL